ncbi:MAG: methionyl-tRNA formyltransferase [Elusimicrobiota bacterium]|nr:methionyl-tRNA formyltransferase [Elusimicrobiota bacterium]
MRILFMGTPDFSLQFLKKIMESDEIVAIVTQGDRPARRGHRLEYSEVKKFSLETNLTLFQPAEITDSNFVKSVKELAPDLIVVVAFGKVLSSEILTIPGKGCVNIHFSLLPKYRGPAPVQWALLEGDYYTGVSSIFMEEEVDSGDIILQKRISIDPEDNYLTLQNKLCKAGVVLLEETLNLIREGKNSGHPQDDSGISYAPLLKKSDGQINWNDASGKICNRIRALNPWPGTYIEMDGGKKVKILGAKIMPVPVKADKEGSPKPGKIVEIRRGEGFVVTCGEGSLLVTLVQPENKPIQKAYDYLQGARLKVGDMWGKE